MMKVFFVTPTDTSAAPPLFPVLGEFKIKPAVVRLPFTSNVPEYIEPEELRFILPPKNWTNVITTVGQSPWIHDENDGVVTLESMRFRKDFELVEGRLKIDNEMAKKGRVGVTLKMFVPVKEALIKDVNLF